MYGIQVTFGHSTYEGIPVDPLRIRAAEEKILATFAYVFRGGHLHQVQGSFQNRNGLLMLENCTIASCETDHLGRARLKALRETLCWIRKALDQETVLLTISWIDGKHHWVG